jgi:hypothetical protein
MTHRIVDLSGAPVKGSCSFAYRGHRISLSTVFPTRDVAVFLADGREVHGLDDAVEAIRVIEGWWADHAAAPAVARGDKA